MAVVEFTASGTWQVPYGVIAVDIECIGAGGGGGGFYSGGGAGNGGTGGDTSVVRGGSTVCLAKGGGGGGAGAALSGNGAGGSGGAAANGTGTTKYSGGNGSSGDNANSNIYPGGAGGGAGDTGAGNAATAASPFTNVSGGAKSTRGGAGGNNPYDPGKSFTAQSAGSNYGGGGGSGAASSSSAYGNGGGGGGGACSLTPGQVVAPTETLTITVGTAGTAGSSPGGSAMAGRAGAGGYVRITYTEPTGYDAEVYADTPIAHWPLNEASGTTAKNWGNGGAARDATYQNTPETYRAGALRLGGQSVSLERGTNANSDDYISVADASWQSGISALTIEAWVINESALTGDPEWRTIVSKANVSGTAVAFNLDYRREGGTLKIRLDIGGAGGSNQGHWTWNVTLTVGTAYHIVATWQSGSWNAAAGKLYVNGTDQGTATYTADGTPTGTTIYDTTTGVVIGAWSSDNAIDHWDGQISDVALYSTALSSSRVTAHYNAGLAAVAPVPDVNHPPAAAPESPRERLV